LKLPYLEVLEKSPEGKTERRIKYPILSVTLRLGTEEIGDFPVLIDTGSTSCVFNAFIAKGLGIEKVEKGKKKQIIGIGGEENVHFFEVLMKVEDGQFSPCEVGFSPKSNLPYGGVLGYFAFLDRFTVRLENEFLR